MEWGFDGENVAGGMWLSGLIITVQSEHGFSWMPAVVWLS